jgi:hypothetical protein
MATVAENSNSDTTQREIGHPKNLTAAINRQTATEGDHMHHIMRTLLPSHLLFIIILTLFYSRFLAFYLDYGNLPIILPFEPTDPLQQIVTLFLIFCVTRKSPEDGLL